MEDQIIVVDEILRSSKAVLIRLGSFFYNKD